MNYATIRTGYNTYETVEVENEDQVAEIEAENALNGYDEMGYENEY